MAVMLSEPITIGTIETVFPSLLGARAGESVDGRVMTWDAADSNLIDRTSFHWNLSITDNPEGGIPDAVVNYGWNLSPGGGAVIPGQPALGYQNERSFGPFREMHILAVPYRPDNLPEGTTQIRPFSLTWNATTNDFDWYHTISRFYLNDPKRAYDDPRRTYLHATPETFTLLGANLEVRDANNVLTGRIGFDGTSMVRAIGINTYLAANSPTGAFYSHFVHKPNTQAWFRGTCIAPGIGEGQGMSATLEQWGGKLGGYWTTEPVTAPKLPIAVGIKNGAHRWLDLQPDGWLRLSSNGTGWTSMRSNSGSLELVADLILPIGKLRIGSAVSIPNTSGLALEALEAEVNKLKDRFRSTGLIS